MLSSHSGRYGGVVPVKGQRGLLGSGALAGDAIISSPPRERSGRVVTLETECHRMGTAAKQDEPEWGEDVKAAKAILPAWLTARMMTDDWLFGLLLVTGQVAVIQRITAVTKDASGTVWLDVLLANEAGPFVLKAGSVAVPVILAPTDRTEASINTSTVVMALELTTS